MFGHGGRTAGRAGDRVMTAELADAEADREANHHDRRHHDGADPQPGTASARHRARTVREASFTRPP